MIPPKTFKSVMSEGAEKARNKELTSRGPYPFEDVYRIDAIYEAAFRDCAKWLLGHELLNDMRINVEMVSKNAPSFMDKACAQSVLKDLEQLKAEVEGDL